ncbi:MAG: carbon storage regulator [Bryobacterales bacterium]|nr:carbon storage regulator [Bryobacterales bacterium]
MLVLSRRVGETVLIGEDVEIQIMDVSPTRVKLGIAAPKQLSILRGEIRETERQNQAAPLSAGAESLARLADRLRRATTKTTVGG